MNIFKRVLISILRTPLKTLILLLIVLIIGTTISGTISAFQAITHTEHHLSRLMPPIVEIEMVERVVWYWDIETEF